MSNHEPRFDDPWIGRRIDGFRLVSRIGRGSTGVVYEAVQEPLGRPAAVKLLGVGAQRDLPRARARFEREAALLGRLTHPHTVRVYAYGVTDGHPWLAMELCVGSSLAELMGHAPMDPLRLVRIVRQVCASLQEAHGVGLVHRDLKPANIIVQRDDEGQDSVKVLDFGLVKPVAGAEHLTATGLLVGTPMFMSPEQIRGLGEVDQRSDLYALGVLLYRGLTGVYPFLMDGTAAVLMAHLQETPRAIPPEIGVPRGLATLVARLLEKHPDDRPPSVADVGAQLSLIELVLLGELSGSFDTHSLRSEPRASSAGTSLSHALWGVAVVTALAVFGLVAALGGFYAMRAYVASQS